MNLSFWARNPGWIDLCCYVKSYEWGRLLKRVGIGLVRVTQEISTFNEIRHYKENWKGTRKVWNDNPKVGNLKEEGVVDMLDDLDSAHCIPQLSRWWPWQEQFQWNAKSRSQASNMRKLMQIVWNYLFGKIAMKGERKLGNLEKNTE